MDFADWRHDFRVERRVQKMLVGENDGITDKFHYGNSELRQIFNHVWGDTDPGHFLNRMCFVVTVDKQVGFIAIYSDCIIPFFRADAVQLVGYTAAELGDADVEAFPIR